MTLRAQKVCDNCERTERRYEPKLWEFSIFGFHMKLHFCSPDCCIEWLQAMKDREAGREITG